MSGIVSWAEIHEARDRLLAALELERAVGCPEVRLERGETDAERALRRSVLEVEVLAYDEAHPGRSAARVELRAVS